MKEMSDEMAPRRFGLWYVIDNWDDAELVGWGYATEDETILDLPSSTFRVEPRALDRMLKRLNLCAIWVDPELVG